MSEEADYHIDRDALRANLNKYTRQAYSMLPDTDSPRILDIGCGSGVPTIELAKLSGGEIIALDNDRTALDKLTKKLREQGLTDRVTVVERSMIKMDFPNESFDVIWAEGSISVIGFRKGLKEWRRFLMSSGFLVVLDEIGNLKQKLEQVSRFGYELIGHFLLSEEIWWREYYAPLSKRIHDLRRQFGDDPDAVAYLKREHRDVDAFKKNPGLHRCVFLIMQRKSKI